MDTPPTSSTWISMTEEADCVMTILSCPVFPRSHPTGIYHPGALVGATRSHRPVFGGLCALSSRAATTPMTGGGWWLGGSPPIMASEGAVTRGSISSRMFKRC